VGGGCLGGLCAGGGGRGLVEGAAEMEMGG